MKPGNGQYGILERCQFLQDLLVLKDKRRKCRIASSYRG